jgi:mRNA-degrading endonuclease RelE of RelBE toxin-antitoxin system
MYKVKFKKSAEKDLGKINSIYYQSVLSHIMRLANNPHPVGSIKLSVSENAYRLRVGIYPLAGASTNQLKKGTV